ncbi:MAG: hypothetical protein WC348_00465 [Patescibacteria group bacterium]|jgi:hypothetical protein
MVFRNSPSSEQHEEQERIKWAEETMKREIEQIAAQLNDILGKENYVIDREGKITPTRQGDLKLEPKESELVEQLEKRLRQVYGDLKKVHKST